MKTQQELMQAYWGPGGTVDMVKEYNEKHGCDVKPWECVKDTVTGDVCCHDPAFVNDHDQYSIALAILYDDKSKEHRPVFVGNKIYDKNGTGTPWTISYPVSANFEAWNKWSWNPQTPKRTFKLNDVELPCPVKDSIGIHNDFFLQVGHYYFGFNSVADRNDVAAAMYDLLTAARDKE